MGLRITGLSGVRFALQCAATALLVKAVWILGPALTGWEAFLCVLCLYLGVWLLIKGEEPVQ